MSVSIKDIDEKAFRSLKAEAAKAGMKVGDAASEAFRMWVISKRLGRFAIKIGCSKQPDKWIFSEMRRRPNGLAWRRFANGETGGSSIRCICCLKVVL